MGSFGIGRGPSEPLTGDTVGVAELPEVIPLAPGLRLGRPLVVVDSDVAPLDALDTGALCAGALATGALGAGSGAEA